jgi:hypothetical protein
LKTRQLLGFSPKSAVFRLNSLIEICISKSWKENWKDGTPIAIGGNVEVFSEIPLRREETGKLEDWKNGCLTGELLLMPYALRLATANC